MKLSRFLPRSSRLIFAFLLFTCIHTTAQQGSTAKSKSVPGKVWTAEKANKWYAQQASITGADFLPSTAINQLEMWQATTFDTATISKELGWAHGIGFNTMRVYLHSVAWKQDPAGFKKRVGQYLAIADRHRIKTILVFFDDCWNKVPAAGTQPAPQPGIHNSGWVQDPGQPMSGDSSLFPGLEKYVTDVMRHFSRDKRILLWDLYNEPGNSDKGNLSMPLLKKVFSWARKVNPEQPISAGVWKWDLIDLNTFQVANSDVITYHDYEDSAWHQRVIEFLKMHGRPLICTEYMARSRNSTFSTILPLLKKHNVGALNWGLVSGKSNTIYAWDTPMKEGGEPALWFHDIFRKDGTPYKQEEVDLIKQLNGVK